ncbi:hypothetical protein [Malonomonas rubra]|uniref:hypothetical protein n=1 Tax=Malonomonas rubra TaxID=57040 RepID=UPI0026EC358E|nr:hypothetical protein [Malonomonas rubra]
MRNAFSKHWLVVLSPVTIDLSKGFFASQSTAANCGGGNGGDGASGMPNRHQNQIQYQYDTFQDQPQDQTRSRDRVHAGEPEVAKPVGEISE